MEIRSHGDGSAWEYHGYYVEVSNGSGNSDGSGGNTGGGGDGWGTFTGDGDGDGVCDSGDISGNGQTSNGFKEWNFKIK